MGQERGNILGSALGCEPHHSAARGEGRSPAASAAAEAPSPARAEASAGPGAADLHSPLWRDARPGRPPGSDARGRPAAREPGAPGRGGAHPPAPPPGRHWSSRPDPGRGLGLPPPAGLGAPGWHRDARPPSPHLPAPPRAASRPRSRPATSRQGRGTGAACRSSAGCQPPVLAASAPVPRRRHPKAAGTPAGTSRGQAGGSRPAAALIHRRPGRSPHASADP